MRRLPRDPLRMLLAKPFVAAPHDDDVAGLHRHAFTPGHLVQLLRHYRITDRDVALLAPSRDVEQHTARGDAVEQRIDRAPRRAGHAQAVLERAAVVELAIPRHVAERIDVRDPEAV